MMWAICGSIFLFIATGSCTQISTTKMQLPAGKPSACDSPNRLKVDADKCCQFPDLFNDTMVDQCEKEFSLNSSLVNNEMLADSCVIECVFNRSGLNNKSKLVRDDVVKVFMNRTKDDKVWNSLITKAIDTCFNELSPEAVDEYMESFSNSTTSNKKLLNHKVCHPIAAFALDCIYIELFKVCPQEKFNQTLTDCAPLKNYAIECDDW